MTFSKIFLIIFTSREPVTLGIFTVLDSELLQVALVIKNPASAGGIRDVGSIPGSGRSPGVANGNPLQCSCLGNPMDKRTQEGYSPQGHKELDMTEAT